MKDFKLLMLQESYAKKKYEGRSKKEIALLTSNLRKEISQQNEILGEVGLIFMQISLAYKREPLLRTLVNYQIEKNKDELLKIIQNGLPIED